RNVAPLSSEDPRRKLTGSFGRLRRGALTRQEAQAIELTRSNDVPRVLGGRAEDTARTAVIVHQRRERKSDVRFLEITAAQQRHQEVGLTGRPASGEGLGESA